MSRSLSPLSCPAVACSTTPGVATCTLLHSPASGLAVQELPLPSPITFYLQSLLLSFCSTVLLQLLPSFLLIIMTNIIALSLLSELSLVYTNM